MSDAAKNPNAQIGQLPSDQAAESAVIAGAAAIQRLIAERNSLRSRAGAQERELTSLRATNEDLRRHITVIRNSYMRLATEFVTHLQHIDDAIRKVLHEPTGPAELRASRTGHSNEESQPWKETGRLQANRNGESLSEPCVAWDRSTSEASPKAVGSRGEHGG
jgi:hypothetical protein